MLMTRTFSFKLNQLFLHVSFVVHECEFLQFGKKINQSVCLPDDLCLSVCPAAKSKTGVSKRVYSRETQDGATTRVDCVDIS